MSLRLSLVIAALLISPTLVLIEPRTSFAAEPSLPAYYGDLSLRLPTTDLVAVCHGVGCRYRTEIALSAADRTRLGALLAPGRPSPAFERRAVANAVAWFDRRIGPVAGTEHRVASAGIDETGDPGQMDSIDTSTNITSLLLVLDLLHLLRHHQVEPPASRAEPAESELPQATAVLREINAGTSWAVDNWTQNYGEPPDVEPLERWQSDRN